MRGATTYLRGGLFASLIACLSACVAGMPLDFGGNGCRTVYVLSGGVIQPVNTCGGIPREGLTAQKTAPAARAPATPVAGADLPALLAAAKFEPDAYYTGVDAPEDKAPLTAIINNAVRDLIAMPEPRDPATVRQRLQQAIGGLDAFVTEDREQGYMYLVLAWRAAGFPSESGLFPVSDEQIIGVF